MAARTAADKEKSNSAPGKLRRHEEYVRLVRRFRETSSGARYAQDSVTAKIMELDFNRCAEEAQALRAKLDEAYARLGMME